ncbi:hypothetical protein [Oceanobacillus sp. FSL K6-0251]|uniref:hypothetical protein n=1 Tax=Oceanobacillus sp. FSL K6-0251 TaxID=2921602 RepID=UPI0030F93CC2
MEKNKDFKKVQLYLEDLLSLHNVSKGLAPLLFHLTTYANPQKHIIVNSFLKKELAMKTNSSKGTIENYISRLNEVGLIKRIDRGTYTFHSVILGVDKIVKNEPIKVTISYMADGRKIHSE